MAIGSIPPWIRGPNTLEALSSGAGAGGSAARTEQAGQFESARLGMEAERMRQGAAIQQAQLQQAAEQHAIEFQARAKLAEQNQEREQQRLNIENAYKTAALGIAKGRLEETQAIADQKAKAAALMFQQEQGFHNYLKEHPGDILGAWQSFPRVSPQMVNATREAIQHGAPDKLEVREGKYPILTVNPQTGETVQRWTPPENNTEILKNLRHDRDQLEKETPRSDEEKQLNQDKLNAIRYRIDRLSHGKSLTTPTASTGTVSTASKSRAPKAGEVYNGHKFKGGDPSDQNNWEEVRGEGE